MLTLEQLFAEPNLGLRLVAGGREFDGRRSIRWVHCTEVPDPSQWLEGGELVLTTGLGIADSPGLQRAMVASLAASSSVALGFGVGVAVHKVPDALKSAAKEFGLPLFTVPYEVPFIAVTRFVCDRLFADHYSSIQQAANLYREIMEVIYSGRGLPGILAMLSRQIPDASAICLDVHGGVREEYIASVVPLDHEKIRIAVAAMLAEEQPDREQDGYWTHIDITHARQSRCGTLVVVAKHRLSHLETILFQQALAGVSLILTESLMFREARRSEVEQMLEEAAEERSSHRVVAKAMRRLGCDVDSMFVVLWIRLPSRADIFRCCNVIEDRLAAMSFAPIVGRQHGALVCIVQTHDAFGAAGQLHDALCSEGCREARIGVGGPKLGVEEVNVAIQEARIAAEASGRNSTPIRGIEAVGLSSIVANIQGRFPGAIFAEHVLSPLVSDDSGHYGSELLDTLRVYLRHGCRSGPTSQELCVHRHTLTYRLRRISELTGRDLGNGFDLLELGLALELHQGENRLTGDDHLSEEYPGVKPNGIGA